MELSGLELIKAYRSDPEKYLPMPDRTGVTPRVNEYGEVNIGWNAGLLGVNRPYFVECWAVDGITMLTFYFSSDGIENKPHKELLQMLLDTGYFRFRNNAAGGYEFSSNNDPQGNKYFSCNVAVGVDEDPPLIEGAPIFPWSVLNRYNKSEEGPVPAGQEHVKIWLDDVREAPDGYYHCRSVNAAKAKIEACEKAGTVIDVIDCDHDLGDYAADGGDGIRLIDWLAERGTHYPMEIHTMNPVGRDNMQREIERYWNDGA